MESELGTTLLNKQYRNKCKNQALNWAVS